jgi:hypothetical protein
MDFWGPKNQKNGTFQTASFSASPVGSKDHADHGHRHEHPGCHHTEFRIAASWAEWMALALVKARFMAYYPAW